MRIRQSFCYPLFRAKGAPIGPLFAAAASIGFAAVEAWFYNPEFEEFFALAREHRLAIASISGHTSLSDGLNQRAHHERIADEIHVSIDRAVRHGIPGLICFSGNRNADQSEDDAIDAVASGLRRCVPYAERHGVNLNLELLNSRVDHPGYQCDHTAWGVKVCQRVNSPRVKLLYDIYHMQIMEGDVIRTLRENIHHIGHIHTAGNPGRRDLDDAQELNYAGICRAIAATSYTGYVGHEFSPKGDAIAALRSAFAICDQSAPPAGLS